MRVDQLDIGRVDQPEEPAVDGLAEGVARVGCLLEVERHGDDVVARDELPRAQRVVHVARLGAEQGGHVTQRLARCDCRVLLAVLLKVELREQQHDGDRARRGHLLLDVHPHRLHRAARAPKLGAVVDAVDGEAAALVDSATSPSAPQVHPLPLLVREPVKLVEAWLLLAFCRRATSSR